ncbi:MAG: hypothetical protein ABFD86_05730 [Bryobacteraceae bacterium]
MPISIGRREFLSASLAVPALGAARKPKNWVWIPTNTRRTPDDWKRRFDEMRASGIRAILP